jgi:hypothetical protein
LSAQVVTDKKVIWDYPVKPGMKEWDELKTEKAHVDALQVPDEILENMPTEDIVRLCISLPAFGHFTAFNTPQQGFGVMLSRFNVLQHLMLRKDAGKYLLSAYKDAGMSGFKKFPYANNLWTIKLEYLELLLSQKEVLLPLTPAEKGELLMEARKKFSEKVKSESFASLPGLQSTVRIIVNTLEDEVKRGVNNLSNKQMIEEFARTGLANNAEILNEVIRITDRYIKDNINPLIK